MTDTEHRALVEALATSFSQHFKAHLSQPNMKHVEAALHIRPCYLGSRLFFETLAAIAIRELKENSNET